MSLDDVDRAELQRLEESLWRPETRFDRDYMESVLAPDAREFGRSGRSYDRRAIIDATAGEIRAEWPLRELTVQPVAADVALVTYVSVAEYESVEVSHRSTLWVRHAGTWRMVFHQGTPISG